MNYHIPTMEKAYIIEALVRTNNKPKKASELLGINERTLFRKRKQHNIITIEIKAIIQKRNNESNSYNSRKHN